MDLLLSRLEHNVLSLKADKAAQIVLGYLPQPSGLRW